MKAPSPYRLTLSVLALLCGAESAQAVLVSFAATYNFANPTATNGAAGQAVHTVSGTWGSFDIIVLDGNGNPGGYFDNNLGIGGTDGVDFGINAGDAPLTFTFGNYTGLLASQTGSPNGQTLLIENIRFGRFGGNANDAGRYADSNGNSFTFSQNGAGFDTSIPNTDRYVFGTPLRTHRLRLRRLPLFPPWARPASMSEKADPSR